MKFAFAIAIGAEAVSLADIAAEVNAKATTWTAQAPSNFRDTDDVKPYLGAYLPGDALYKEDAVKELLLSTQLPSEFDSATKWPACSVISNVRDQSSCGSCWAFASVSSFEARACIANGQDVKYSPEQTAFCFNDDGCGGGNSVWSDFKSSGVVTGGDYGDEEGATCSRYSLQACAHHVPADAKYPACRRQNTTLHPAQPVVKVGMESCSHRTSCMLTALTVCVVRPPSCKSWLTMAPCMWLSVSMVTSQRTNQVCTSTRLDLTLVVMQSLWLVLGSLMVRSTGRSGIHGMRIGVTMATS